MCAMRCARCDYEFPDGDRFCGRCGLSLSADGQQVDPLLGLTLDGRYRIEKRIGAGGMGTVYLAAHARMGQKVAVKVLHERCAQSPPFIQRFENEALTYGRLNHPNLVSLHDFGRTSDGTLYMVLEYCPGVALSALLKERGRLGADEAVDIIVQVAQGLDAAHQQGVVHRDLKPANIMLVETRPGRHHVRLLDFGIAKWLDEDGPGLTQAGMVFGTPEYMAPEQARGERVDARTDVYALGAILYELVTGRPPFTGTNKMRVMHCNANEPPPPPSTLAPAGAVPPGLEAVILRCLAKRPEERFQSCTDLIDALEGLDPLPVTRPARDSGRSPALAPPTASPREDRTTRGPVSLGEGAPSSTSGWSLATVERPSGPSRAAVAAAVAIFVGAIGVSAWFWHGGAAEPAEQVTARADLVPVDAAPQLPAAPVVRVAAVPAPVTAAVVEAPKVAPKPAVARVVEPPAVKRADPPARPAAPSKRDKVVAAKPHADKPAPTPAEEDAPVASEDAPPAPRKQTGLAGATAALHDGRFDEAEKAVDAVLAKTPDDAKARSLKERIRAAREGMERGRVAFENADCVTALQALEPVLAVAPGTDGASHIVEKCRESLPPRQL
jgi:serine/threonine-protein kinase